MRGKNTFKFKDIKININKNEKYFYNVFINDLNFYFI